MVKFLLNALVYIPFPSIFFISRNKCAFKEKNNKFNQQMHNSAYKNNTVFINAVN